MSHIRLTQEEKATLERRHKNCTHSKESDRMKAVLLRSEGWTVSSISQALRRHESTIIRHLNDFREGKLSLTSGGSDSRLSSSQTEALMAHLEAHTYHHVHDIIAYIESRWSIHYSVPGMNKCLHRNGFSYKNPKGHPYKADKVRQKAFVEKYHALKEALEADDALYFSDSVHPSQATKLSYGWIRKGHDKKLETTASRTRVNIMGALRLDAISHTIAAQYETINAESIVSHLRLVRQHHGAKGKIIWILDQAPYHRAEAVVKEAQKLNIQLEYLPPYSPNLNPIERLWKVMNEQVRNNHFFKSAKDFKKAIKRFFNEILPKIGDSLSGRINDNFQML